MMPLEQLAIDEYLDCRGLSCPVPIVRISRVMKTLLPGQVLRVVATDEAFYDDLEAWLSMRADELVSFDRNCAEGQCALLRKGREGRAGGLD